MNWKARLGLWRSLLIYYWKPFNQKRLRRFYSQFIQPGDLCFDIGAHLGNRSKAWLDLGAKVIAVEPQPICIQFLQKKFDKYPDWTIESKAVGAKNGKLPMYLSQNAPTVSSLSDQNWRKALNEKSNFEVQWNEEIEVEVTTLDQLIEQYGRPTFCKIDVEDFEEAVLKGLSVPIPIISFEFFNWTPIRTEACLKLLNQLGDYEYNWSFGESLSFEMEKWENVEQLSKNIEAYKKKNAFSGDIYARIKP